MCVCVLEMLASVVFTSPPSCWGDFLDLFDCVFVCVCVFVLGCVLGCVFFSLCVCVMVFPGGVVF